MISLLTKLFSLAITNFIDQIKGITTSSAKDVLGSTAHKISTNVEMNEDVAMKLAVQRSLEDAGPMVPNPDGGRDYHIDQLRKPSARTSRFEMRYYNNRLNTKKKARADEMEETFENSNSDEFEESDFLEPPPSTQKFAASRRNHSTKKVDKKLAYPPTTMSSEDNSYIGRLRTEIINRIKLINTFKIDPITLQKLRSIYTFLGRSDALTTSDPVVSSFVCIARDAERSSWNVGDTIDVMLTMFG